MSKYLVTKGKCSDCGFIQDDCFVVAHLGKEWGGSGCDRCDAPRVYPMPDAPKKEFGDFRAVRDYLGWD